MKTISFVLFALFSFCALTCKKESPTAPPSELDTTSHAWTFTINLLGDGGGSELYDISIVNDSLVYAVGAVYKRDSSGNFEINPFNLAVFDGQRWNLEQVSVSFHGNTIIVPLQGVCAFSSTEIWFAGSLPIYGNGATWQMYDLRTTLNPYIDVSKAWGPNSQQMYFVGLNGTIVSYFNGSWQKLASGTSLNIQDAYGAGNNILAVASNPGESLDKEILQINGTSVTQLSTAPIQWPLSSVWFAPGHYYLVGQGIYGRLLQITFGSRIPLTLLTSSRVFGATHGMISLWLEDTDNYCTSTESRGDRYQSILGLQNGSIARIAVKGNLMIGVGSLGSKAVAFIGRR